MPNKISKLDLGGDMRRVGGREEEGEIIDLYSNKNKTKFYKEWRKNHKYSHMMRSLIN